jgi:hypothetical protein
MSRLHSARRRVRQALVAYGVAEGETGTDPKEDAR